MLLSGDGVTVANTHTAAALQRFDVCALSVMSIYDEIEIEDMTFIAGERGGSFTYPCPCGDRFILSAEELLCGEDVAPCPSCSLRIRVVFDADTLEDVISAAQAKAAGAGAPGGAVVGGAQEEGAAPAVPAPAAAATGGSEGAAAAAAAPDHAS